MTEIDIENSKIQFVHNLDKYIFQNKQLPHKIVECERKLDKIEKISFCHTIRFTSFLRHFV